ncbi:unnamed protein product [Thelazia callipaeda]|uniref:Helicase ATP-binding domain-containing protein n=1 Tax=Thelazia callipaeda TaxID=103827 RepID=A0A0N5D2D0_THECL|nr:unnamed protein product [Thelazia callipaeda]
MNEFSFPFEPYDIQISLMRIITSCIENGKIGILESPTGTGKSMSIICSTLTWLEKYEAERKADLEQKLKSLQEAGNGDVDNDISLDEEDWLKAHIKKFNAIDSANDLFAQAENDKKIDERIQKALKNIVTERKRRSFHAVDVEEQQNNEDDVRQNGEENLCNLHFYSLQLLGESKSVDENVAKNTKEVAPTCIKIIYATRTHSQLEQFAEEIKKTRFKPRIVTLGSRQHFCINESVRALKQLGLMVERCNELRDNKSSVKRYKDGESNLVIKDSKGSCPFARNDAIEDLCDQILASKLSTVSQLVDCGQKISGCPYFASRKAVAYSQMILLPYQILFQEETRKAWGVDFKDNVIVIDEAHNLLETITSSHFVTFHVKEMNIVLSTLKPTLIQICLAEYDLDQLLKYFEETHLIIKLSKFSKRMGMVKKQETDVDHKFSVERFLQSQNSLDQHQDTCVLKDLESQCSSPSTECSSLSTEEPSTASAFCALQLFLRELRMSYRYGRIIVECPSDIDQAKISYYLMNPASQLCDLIEQSKSLILIGGTMEPSDTLIDILARSCKIDPEKDLIRRSFGHVIEKKQLLAVTITNVDKKNLIFTYEKRENPTTLKLLMTTLTQIAEVVPHGMVVFFPSYSFLDTFTQKLPMNLLQKVKPLLIEKRNSPKTLFTNFANLARTKRGALLLAVIGGKLSEGINFSDELGRAVAVVGLPYLNSSSIVLKEKLKFMQNEYGPKSGAKYYEAKCMHAINQSIGRVIRHRKDHAAIVLLDLRYEKEQVIRCLPCWIQSQLHHAMDLKNGVEHLRRFFKSMNESKS